MSFRRGIAIALFFSAICGSACKSKSSPESADAAPKMADVSASATLPPSSAAPVVAKNSAAKESKDGGGKNLNSVSLLTWTDARVAVSSTVDNPRDFPEHLIDKKLDTAWNGKTGDLVHGFIAVRIPREAHVQKIRLTAGYVAKGKDGRDLFTSNYRISGARIWRDGSPFRDIVPDIENRDVQSFDVDTAGGDFKIEVLEVAAGSMTNWKELVVSEFDVIGDPGNAKLSAPHMPRVRVGSLDAKLSEAEKEGGFPIAANPSATIAQYCNSYVAHHEPSVVEEFSAANFPCADPKAHASCSRGNDEAITSADPFVALTSIDFAGTSSEGTDFAVVTKNGAYDLVGGESRGRCELGDPGTESFKVIAREVARGPGGAPMFLVVTEATESSPMYSDPETGAPGMWLAVSSKRELVVCTIEAERPNCKKRIALGSFLGKNDVEPFDQWDDAKSFVVKADGAIVMTPITARLARTSDAGSP